MYVHLTYITENTEQVNFLYRDLHFINFATVISAVFYGLLIYPSIQDSDQLEVTSRDLSVLAVNHFKTTN